MAILTVITSELTIFMTIEVLVDDDWTNNVTITPT